MDTHTKRFNIAIFLDGRPGHEKQTMGIVDSLQTLVPLSYKTIHVTRQGAFQQLLHMVSFLLGGCPIPRQDLSEVDFIIGTGTTTHLPMLCCKRQYKIPAITCMTPSRLLMSKFDLCFVPQHDGIPPGGNIFATIGPPNRSLSESIHDNKKSLILIGGIDEKSHHWKTQEIIEQVESLLIRDKTILWTISTSPRTPKITEERLFEISEDKENVEFYPFQETPPGWVEKEYTKNKTVWVTGDSMSMVYEALSGGCNVGILPVNWKKKESKFVRSERFLIENNHVLSYQSWLQMDQSWTLGDGLNEAERCAKEIIKRWIKKN